MTMRRTVTLLPLVLLATLTLAAQERAPATKPVSADFVFPGEKAVLPDALTAALAGLKADAIGAHIAAFASAWLVADAPAAPRR